LNVLNDVLPAHPRIRRYVAAWLLGFVLALVLPSAPAQQATGSVPATACAAKVHVMDVRYEKVMESDITQRVVSAFAGAGIQRPAIFYRHTPAAPYLKLTR
jgi:hypothetical protein